MTPGKDEVKRIHENWLEQCVYKPIEKFMKSGRYEVKDMNNMIYRLFDKKGLFQFSDKRENDIIEQAKKEFLYKNKRQYNAESHNELINVLQKGNKDVDGLIELIRNRIKLKTFLSDCRQVNRDILTEIKNQNYEWKSI